MAAASSCSSLEILQAHAELYKLGYAYLKSMALKCAIMLGIPNAISSCGGSASLSDLLAAVPMPEHRKPYLPRLMRFLTAIGIFALDDSPPAAADENAAAAEGRVTDMYYRLTPVSRLLVDDVGTNGCTNLSPFVLSQTTKYTVTASMHLSEWFQGLDGETTQTAQMPFEMAYGTHMWDYFERDPPVSEVFNNGLASDSQFVLDFAVTRCGEVFDGITSLIDVGGGIGGAAKTIAKAFPHIKCSVLDLSSVISTIEPADGIIEYIAGDMMDYIPPTDAVLLKYVLHDWSDEECVKILSQCKKAICSRNRTSGKVIIIDSIVGSTSKDMFEVQVLLDLMMMVKTSGKEREEHEWRKIFMDAGFGHYKTRPLVGFLSIIELYPAAET